MSKEMKKNPIQYIEHLEYKNRTKKIQEEERLKKAGHVIEREGNFHLFFNGANDQRVKDNRMRNSLEKSKSPSNRQKWLSKQQHPPLPPHRKKWDHPETPFMLKEIKEVHEANIHELHHGRSREELEKHDLHTHTRSTFKVAANNLIRPDSHSEINDIAQRIEKLNSQQKDRLMKILEQLEQGGLNVTEI